MAAAGDVRSELFSGDALKQTAALMGAFGALSAGQDVAALVSAALQLLGNPSTAAEPKRIAYDLAMAAQLSDSGTSGRWSAAAVGCVGRLAGGDPAPC